MKSILQEIRDALPEYLRAVQADIDDDFRAYEDDEEPGIQVTIATDGTDYTAQTGDNSYTGPVYSFPHWAVTAIYRDSDIEEVADDVVSQLADLMEAWA